MSSLTPEKAIEIANKIINYYQDDQVKKALAKQGYKIVPNSLKQLIEGLEKAGYVVTKDTPSQTVETTTSPSKPQEESTKEQPESVEKKEEVIHNQPIPEEASVTINEPQFVELALFGGRAVLSSEPEQETNEPIKEEVPAVISEPQSPPSVPAEEPIVTIQQEENPIIEEKPVDQRSLFITKWPEVLKAVKEVSISFNALVMNAKPVAIENNELILSFNPQSSYQLNQFKREQNIAKFNQIISTVFQTNLTVKPIISEEYIVADKKASGTVELPLFGGRNI